jgi:thymidylate kinase
MIDQFDQMADEYDFHIIDANRSITDINEEIKDNLKQILE